MTGDRIDERRHWDMDGFLVLRAAARAYGTTWRAMTGPSRTKVLVAARAQVAQELREKGWTLAQIGELLGSRHHTTIMNLLETA